MTEPSLYKGAINAKLAQLKSRVFEEGENWNLTDTERKMAATLLLSADIVRDYTPEKLEPAYEHSANYRAQVIVAARLLHPENLCHEHTKVGKEYLRNVGRKGAVGPSSANAPISSRTLRPYFIRYLEAIEKSALEADVKYLTSGDVSLNERIKMAADEMSGNSPEVLAAVQAMPKTTDRSSPPL